MTINKENVSMSYLLRIKILIVVLPLLLTISIYKVKSQAVDVGLTCSPTSLKPGDILTIKMPQDHGCEFAVITPDKEYFFVVYRKPDRLSPLRPIMSSDEFVKLTEFLIDTAKFEAHPWREGATSYERVFREPGIYRILIGDNLETDSAFDVITCEVKYVIQTDKTKIK